MKRRKQIVAVLISFMVSVMFCCVPDALAAQDIGAVVALRGSAIIDRDAKKIEAKVKDGIQLSDTVETLQRSRTKMLFIDDSVLTMGQNAKVVIKEFIYSKDKRGKSIFNLLDGKMRSVVGRAEFEVRTPTAVAAARGTVFECEVGATGGKSFTTCTSYEGIVDIRSTDPTITGRVLLRPGMRVTVISGQPIPAPTPAPSTFVQPIQAAQGETGAAGPGGGSLPIVVPPQLNPQPAGIQESPAPPPPATTPVNVGINFPSGTTPPPPPSTGSIHVGW
jgi:hypothetical protein